MSKIFYGQILAEQIYADLKIKITNLNFQPILVSFCFTQDPASVLYTEKKVAAAKNLGIIMEVIACEFAANNALLLAPLVKQQQQRPEVVGVMIQKPSRAIFMQAASQLNIPFEQWWESLRALLPEEKDVDGLGIANARKIATGQKAIFPATMRAVLSALQVTNTYPDEKSQILLLGKSDLLGIPLADYWQQQGLMVSLREKQDWPVLKRAGLQQFSHLISATGQAGLIKGEVVREGVVLIDIGEPHGDLDFASCLPKAALITPVPGGIGPLTVACLMQNVIDLATSLKNRALI